MLTVSQLFIYPVKSLGGIEVNSSLITERGLQYDRRWMLVDEEGRFLTQREHAVMALLQTSLTKDGLRVEHKQKQSGIDIPFEPQTNESLMVDIWSDRCRARRVSEEADDWFSDMLSMHCKLVYMPDTTKRRVDGRYALNKDITAFSDGYPTLIIGQSSLDDLNEKLEQPVTIDRFRPNIVFTGGEPYEEDNLEEFSINNIHFYGVKLCARCVMTTINQNTAEKGKEPLKTLARYRFRNNKIYFGQNLLHQGEGEIKKGDLLEPIVKKDKPRSFPSSSH